MAWADIITRTATVEALSSNVRAVIPTDGSRLTALQFTTIRQRGAILRDLGADLAMLADQWHALSQHESDKAAISEITDQQDCTREITQDAQGRETRVVLSSIALNKQVEIASVYDGAVLTSRTVTVSALGGT